MVLGFRVGEVPGVLTFKFDQNQLSGCGGQNLSCPTALATGLNSLSNYTVYETMLLGCITDRL